ncbi:MAG: hypothetical protein CVU84_01005 [Firmicutes bacterium HGW-Firmicutes-1]|jgi:predicted dehydrogenase|nr:MAG: hypothetical protein CVU84_01005 [Firmicutes bacterium HGW-Firmicutes-1]
MNSINYAIIGFGGIARNHALAAYDANLRHNLPYSLNLSYIVTRKPIEISVPGITNVTNLQTVLEDPNLDFISICTPNESHVDIVEQAIAYGKPIYCEKPLASTLLDAEKMNKLVHENNVINGVAFIYRFLPAIALLKEELEKKTIGSIIDFKIKTYHNSYLNKEKQGTWRTLKTSGGGALLDLGSHLIDLIHYTLGNIKEIQYQSRIHFKDRSEVDEITRGEILLDNGTLGSVEASRVFAEEIQTDQMILFGTTGSMKLDLTNPYIIQIHDFNTGSTLYKAVPEKHPSMRFYPKERNSLGFFQNCHTAAIIDFANKLNGMKDTIGADFTDGLKCQEVISKLK